MKNILLSICLLVSLFIICYGQMAVLNSVNCKIMYSYDQSSNIFAVSSCMKQICENDVGSCSNPTIYTYSDTIKCSSSCCENSSLQSYTGLQTCIQNDADKLQQKQREIVILIITLIPVMLFVGLGSCLVIGLIGRLLQKQKAKDKKKQEAKLQDSNHTQSIFKNRQSWITLKDSNYIMQNKICSICYQKYADCETKCNHNFHRFCMVKFGIIASKICPQCFSDKINPIKLYCLKCFKNYLTLSINDDNFFNKFKKGNRMCSQCDKKRFLQSDAIVQADATAQQ